MVTYAIKSKKIIQVIYINFNIKKHGLRKSYGYHNGTAPCSGTEPCNGSPREISVVQRCQSRAAIELGAAIARFIFHLIPLKNRVSNQPEAVLWGHTEFTTTKKAH